jgi:hypothetical protein
VVEVFGASLLSFKIIGVKNGLLINIGRTHITRTIGIVSAVKTRASYPYSLLVTFFRWFHLTQAIFAQTTFQWIIIRDAKSGGQTFLSGRKKTGKNACPPVIIDYIILLLRLSKKPGSIQNSAFIIPPPALFPFQGM